MHKPVLVKEVTELLITRKNGVYVDATLGFGGHARAILSSLESGGRLLGIDQDIDALNASSIADSRFESAKANFADLDVVLYLKGLEGVDGILADIGLSSYQIDELERGFSYNKDAPLDMRMDRDREKRASDVVNSYEEERLANLIYQYGEERLSRRIARAIVMDRAQGAISSTGELVNVIMRSTKGSMSSVRRVFQAIRIEVNDEMRKLEIFLHKAKQLLKPGGRIAVITFHSLEDRMVKNFFKSEGLEQIHKKAIIPSQEEVLENSRAKPAKLRVAQRVFASR